jgi:hypothetical protein
MDRIYHTKEISPSKKKENKNKEIEKERKKQI